MSTSLGLPWVTTDNVFETEILESDSLLEEESVLNTDGQIINLFDLSIYASTLQHEDRCRYAAKLLLVGCDCPYTVHEEYWCNGLTISEKMPQVINLNLVNYLISQLYSDELAAKSKLFIGVVLPELTSKYFTKTRYNVTTDENN
ncbi:Uncharacterized protein APZ42_005569 [Daphnia magna]|uniref:Uncharacterized protein n=2 Tax=Daphnia magna TaxID=35525 RepID=A0A0P5I016_9CRUS|nr:Uncharacterized protein APZ42_005569 [Daphnia magna]